MKRFSIPIALAAALTLCACQQKSNDHDNNHEGHDAQADTNEISANQKLYNEVMDVHDEAMERMDKIHALKTSIREKIQKNPNLPKPEKQKLDALYAKLDSANEGMMDWMHKFKPLPDSTGEEKAKQYLVNEMERVTKVRDNMLKAIEAAEKQ